MKPQKDTLKTSKTRTTASSVHPLSHYLPFHSNSGPLRQLLFLLLSSKTGFFSVCKEIVSQTFTTQ
ncbi:hypothetical protein JZ751_009265 [Albula glossodonta]|uniref:Uncharacterized protein n=1 Tax=Albula glossodonta TaxID=121402 RepID=A0A8T2N1Q4_9TELE|nr:hypothetical protein JZ751_025668 [Albula glossodonta]KAG9330350.1 hypothetical protein JZ751_025653 [Albula glossodonta]KAG9334033.1 hypothetical protein JZ751_009265 [Albula glossodonta]